MLFRLRSFTFQFLIYLFYIKLVIKNYNNYRNNQWNTPKHKGQHIGAGCTLYRCRCIIMGYCQQPAADCGSKAVSYFHTKRCTRIHGTIHSLSRLQIGIFRSLRDKGIKSTAQGTACKRNQAIHPHYYSCISLYNKDQIDCAYYYIYDETPQIQKTNIFQFFTSIGAAIRPITFAAEKTVIIFPK